MKIILTEENLNNLIVFLNRIEYKGLQEVEAISQILFAIKNPIHEEVEGART